LRGRQRGRGPAPPALDTPGRGRPYSCRERRRPRRAPPASAERSDMSEGAKGPLAVGLRYSRSVTVTDEMTPAHLRQEPLRVLSTPDMIRLIEQTAIEAVAPHLAPGQATVGTGVDVVHLAGPAGGLTVDITG